LDTHFAHSMQAVTSWCKAKNNCVTPTQLVTALQSRFRLRNTIVHLVEHNRPQLEEVESIIGRMNDKLKKTVKRCNDVFSTTRSGENVSLMQRLLLKKESSVLHLSSLQHFHIPELGKVFVLPLILPVIRSPHNHLLLVRRIMMKALMKRKAKNQKYWNKLLLTASLIPNRNPVVHQTQNLSTIRYRIHPKLVILRVFQLFLILPFGNEQGGGKSCQLTRILLKLCVKKIISLTTALEK
jgi:hypothetical protein